jgi:hypothetical protein
MSKSLGALSVGLVLTAFALGGCESPIEPPPLPPPEPELTEAFTLQFGLKNPPAGGDCIVTLTAAAKGGDREAYAEWGVLEAQYLNSKTSEWEDVRPQELHEVFLGERIMSGETQTATLNLECYRREVGEQVTARLRLHWVANDDGEEIDRSDMLIAECH